MKKWAFQQNYMPTMLFLSGCTIKIFTLYSLPSNRSVTVTEACGAPGHCITEIQGRYNVIKILAWSTPKNKTLIKVMFQTLQCFMKYHVILDRVITAPDSNTLEVCVDLMLIVSNCLLRFVQHISHLHTCVFYWTCTQKLLYDEPTRCDCDDVHCSGNWHATVVNEQEGHIKTRVISTHCELSSRWWNEIRRFNITCKHSNGNFQDCANQIFHKSHYKHCIFVLVSFSDGRYFIHYNHLGDRTKSLSNYCTVLTTIYHIWIVDILFITTFFGTKPNVCPTMAPF